MLIPGVFVCFDREATQPNTKCVSSTSPRGQSTGCPFTPPACWPLYGESKPLRLPMLVLWSFTAG